MEDDRREKRVSASGALSSGVGLQAHSTPFHASTSDMDDATVTLPPIIVICGPTASGKSLFGVRLAETTNGEIVSADSMQVYTHMDIGTDKPSPEIRRRIPHHMIDMVLPDDPLDAARYQVLASQAIEKIIDSGKKTIVIGGTGLYIRALIRGLFACPPIPQKIRAELKEEARLKGSLFIYEELKRVDPTAARRIHPNDSFRTIRALEVYRATGIPISRLQHARSGSLRRYRSIQLAIDMDRGELYRRIDARVDRMMTRGFVEEVRMLLKLGYGRNLRSMQSIGYRQISDYLNGELSLERAVELIKRDTRRYAKRQLTWFRGDPEVSWLRTEPGGGIGEKGQKLLESLNCQVYS